MILCCKRLLSKDMFLKSVFWVARLSLLRLEIKDAPAVAVRGHGICAVGKGSEEDMPVAQCPAKGDSVIWQTGE